MGQERWWKGRSIAPRPKSSTAAQACKLLVAGNAADRESHQPASLILPPLLCLLFAGSSSVEVEVLPPGPLCGSQAWPSKSPWLPGTMHPLAVDSSRYAAALNRSQRAGPAFMEHVGMRHWDHHRSDFGCEVLGHPREQASRSRSRSELWQTVPASVPHGPAAYGGSYCSDTTVRCSLKRNGASPHPHAGACGC